jgi:hypothetical protein
VRLERNRAEYGRGGLVNLAGLLVADDRSRAIDPEHLVPPSVEAVRPLGIFERRRGSGGGRGNTGAHAAGLGSILGEMRPVTGAGQTVAGPRDR